MTTLFCFGNPSLGMEFDSSLESPTLDLLNQALVEAEASLTVFAQSPDFSAIMALIFGETASEGLRQAWLAGDFSLLPPIEVVSAEILGTANGAFSTQTNRIYISSTYLNQVVASGVVSSLVNLLLEEIGHQIDSILNEQDSPGDEGAIFAAMVQGSPLSSESLALLQTEQDQGLIFVDGDSVVVEKQDFIGGDESNNFIGTPNNDFISGGGGDDALFGREGNDSILGGSGADQLYGEAGNDTLDGGTGDDYFREVPEADVFIGGPGNDRLDLYGTAAGITVIYQNPSGGTISTGGTIKEIEQLFFFGSADGGNDYVDASGALYAQLDGGAGNDTLIGGTGADNLVGGNGNDSILGGGGADQLFGGAGNDTLDGGTGDDYFREVPEADVFIGGPGNDRLDIYAPLAGITITYNNINGGTTSTGGTIKEIEQLFFFGNAEGGDDKVDVSAALYAQLDGGAGNDTLIGGTGADNITGGEGNDSIFGGAGDDQLFGGAGNDSLDGGAGNDYFREVPEADVFIGGPGNDRLDLYGTLAGITVTYNNINGGTTSTGGTIKEIEQLFFFGNAEGGDDKIDASAALYAQLEGKAGNDTLIGGSGDDGLSGGDDDDSLQGGAGRDQLFGGAGNDSLVGVNPNTLNPGFGEVDYQLGGPGADRFVLGDANVYYYDDRNPNSNGTNDYADIADFNPTEGDVVQLRGTANRYRLQVDLNNTQLFLDKPGNEPDELISVFRNITGLNLNSAAFSYIPAVFKPSVLEFSAPQFSVLEDGTAVAAVTVLRTQGSEGEVSVSVALSNGTAKAPADYNGALITVLLADGELSKTVSIPIVKDNIAEPDETVNLLLVNPSQGASIGQQNSATLTILDSTTTPVIRALPQGASGSNQGERTLVITGQNFSPQDQFSLIAPNGTEKAAKKIYWVSETEAWATFDLKGLSTGLYDLKANNGQSNFVANDVFSVTSGVVGNLQFKLSYPAAGFVQVDYTNVGQTDLVAPLLRVTATNATIDFPTGVTTSPSLQQLLNLGLATNGSGPAGVLPPGASGQLTFQYQANANGPLSFNIQTVPANEVINWGSIKAESRADYSFIDNAAWEALWQNLTDAVGQTAGQFQTVLAENATYLSQLGQRTNNVTQLYNFELKQANAALISSPLVSSIDSLDPAPGLSLTFNRVFYQSLTERYNLGTLGRGWSTEWDLRVTTDSDGNILIRNVGDLLRFFAKQGDGTYLDNQGNRITLSNGQYRLKEANGVIFTFANDGKFSAIEDPNGNRITLQYSNNRLTKLLHTNGDSLTLTYNAQGRLSQVTDSAGQSNTYSYDATGELLQSVTTPQGTTTYAYDTGNVAAKKYSLLSVTTNLGYQRTFEYDNQGRLTKEASNNQAETLTYSYDSTGGITVTDSTGAVLKVLVDDQGNSGQIRGVNNQNLRLRYDADGNLLNTGLPNGDTTRYRYDAKGNLIGGVNTLGQNFNFTYDANFSQLTSFTDPKGNGVSYTYDTKGNLTKITYADGSSEQFSIDGLGNITNLVNRRGQSIQYTYNKDGLLTKKQYADNTSVTYSYDARGNLTSVVDGSGTLALQYDTANRLTGLIYPTGRSLQYTYNADGQRTKLVANDGYTVNYSYDTVGRLKTLINGTGQTIISYDYDSAGRLIKETNGNGTYTTYEYDPRSQLSRLTNYKANNTVNSRFEYLYDDLGRRTSMTTLEGVFQYGYDATGQLNFVLAPGGRTLSYQYDGAGNRIVSIDNGATKNYATNSLNQYTTVGNAIYTYDTDGNLISKTEAGQTSAYGYDAENRLVSVVTPQGTWQYQYDGLGNRIATILNGQRTEYLVDPLGLGNVVGEYNPSGNLVANYTYGLGLVSRFDGNGSANYYDADALGSTIGLSGADGSYVNRYSYLPFGESLVKVEGVANPFEYVGQLGVTNDDNGLMFMRARFYDPALGRFTEVDPLNLGGGDTNLYRYALNNPITITDPLGTNPFLAAAGYGAIAGLTGYIATNGYGAGINVQGAAGATASGAIAGFGAGVAATAAVGALVAAEIGLGYGAIAGGVGYGISTIGGANGGFTPGGLGISIISGGLLGRYLPPALGFKYPGGGIKNWPGAQSLYDGLGNGAALSGLLGSLASSLLNALTGGSNGDPHLTTFDGINYDFQAVGEFTFVKSTVDDFEIQTRQQPWGTRNDVSVNTAIALKINGQRIGFYLNENGPRINGISTTLADGTPYALGNSLLLRNGNRYTILTANNDQIVITINGSYLDIGLGLADNRQGKVVGLLGNNNDNPSDDFALRNGTILGGALSAQQLYGDYGNSWRITQATSLFDYGPASAQAFVQALDNGDDFTIAATETTNNFTDPNFPYVITTLEALTPAQRSAAEQVARNAGITDPDLLKDAILDLALTNNAAEFLQGYTALQRQVTINGANTLINPDGFSSQFWMTAGSVLPYTVRFTNNNPAGTTPVAKVVLTVDLDTDLDLTTFSLEDFGFGDIVVDVSTGSQSYAERLDLRSSLGVFVDATADLNATTRTVTWVLTAINPTTGTEANSAISGFLPANNASGAGQGFAGYRIQPKANLSNNPRIDAQARITFNNQTALLSNPVFNTLDTDVPTSRVNALPTNSQANFDVSWSGTDNGSGLAFYDIYVAVDAGPFTLWKDNTTETSAVYNGQVGKTHAFYSVAIDNLGQTEAPPAQADATTTTVGELANVTLAVSPNSVTEDGVNNLVYTFTRAGILTNPLTVNYTIGGTATNGTDYANIANSVVFQVGSATATVIVNPTPDSIVESDETVSLTLATGTGYTIGTTTAVTGTIQNDDFVIPNLSIQDAAIREGNSGTKNLTFTVTLSQTSSQPVSVNYSTATPAGHTATPSNIATPTNPADYTATNGTLTIPAGQLIGQINVPIIGDTLDENSETFVVNLSNPSNAVIQKAQAIGTIEQDDTSTAPLVLKGSTVQIAYVAYYGRPGDPDGLAFWKQVFGAKQAVFGSPEFEDLANSFGNTAPGSEADRLYGALNNRDKVKKVYNLAFNRDPEQGGWDFWTGLLDRNQVTPVNFALAVALGASNGNKPGDNQDLTVIRNKIASADLISNAIDTPLERQATSGPSNEVFGRNWLAPFGDTSASLYAAETALASFVANSNGVF
ncbi:Calx-beta domain-containing protein [Synechocystis sp. LKSZ1]|uniref:Calx-beta domain-containing protein n=1 Tax=Synechocystis sp. LKSZ1 TaxID=3144951 RepID=UPI00336BE4CD